MEMTVSKEKLLKVAKAIQQINSSEVSFSFIIASLFPKAWENIQQALAKEYIKGYNEAKEEFTNAGKGDN